MTGKGWWAANGCGAPNIHRDTRIAIDGSRIETPETFAIDWTRLKDGKTFEGDGARNEDHYAFGADLLAVADGTLRKTYGADFAEGYRSDAELGTVLDREGVATLSEFLKKK